MNSYDTARRNSSRTDKPFNPGQRRNADFARQITIAEFGRHAWALDQDGFEDRQPNQAARRVDGQLARKVA